MPVSIMMMTMATTTMMMTIQLHSKRNNSSKINLSRLAVYIIGISRKGTLFLKSS